MPSRELPSKVPVEMTALHDVAWRWDPTSGDPAAHSSWNTSPWAQPLIFPFLHTHAEPGSPLDGLKDLIQPEDCKWDQLLEGTLVGYKAKPKKNLQSSQLPKSSLQKTFPEGLD